MWVSQEGYCGGTWHGIDADCDGGGYPGLQWLPGLFAPLAQLEIRVHQRQAPAPDCW